MRNENSPQENEFITVFSRFTLVGGTETVSGRAHVLRTDTNGRLSTDPVTAVSFSNAGVEVVYDASPTSATAAAVNCKRFTNGLLQVGFAAVSGTPTNMQVFVDFASASAGSWFALYEPPFTGAGQSGLTLVSATIGSGLRRCWAFPCRGEFVRVRMKATGTDGTDKIGVNDAILTLKTN